MPLGTAQLKTDLAALAANPGANIAACAQKWAQAMEDYATGVVPPTTTIAAARAALESALAASFALPAAGATMETAFAGFAFTVAGGMAPGFIGTPPPGPIGLVAQFAILPYPATHADAGDAIGTLIDTWMKTGTATPSGGGSPVAWT